MRSITQSQRLRLSNSLQTNLESCPSSHQYLTQLKLISLSYVWACLGEIAVTHGMVCVQLN
jgi:hypothetical protein